MPSVKSKNYGQGPHGYFQRVLSDGARPFQYQPQTSRLLGRQRMSGAKPLGANRVSSLSFHYQNPTSHWDSINGISNFEQGMDSIGNLEPNFNSITFENDIDEVHQVEKIVTDSDIHTGNRTTAIRRTNEDMTVLSWLEKMQAQQPLLMQDEPNNNKIVQSMAAIETNQALPSDQKTSVAEENKAKDSSEQLAAITPLSLQIPAQSIQEMGIQNEGSTVSEKITVPVSQSTGIDLPDGPRPKVSRLTDMDDTMISLVPADLTIQVSLPKLKKKHHPEKNNHISIQKPDLIANNSYETHTQSRQQSPETLPVTKPNTVSQGTNISRLQQALRTRPIAGASSTREASSTQMRQESATAKSQQTQAQMQQHVTIVNPPASANHTAAFWERNYMSRFGPRSYK